MTEKSNLHTHTTYCDGANTPREMADAAIMKGFHALGFSGHVPTPFDPSYCMTPLGILAYKDEVRCMSEEYAGRINIYLGVEDDACVEYPSEGLDYVIGSNHYLAVNGKYYAMDNTAEELRACVEAMGCGPLGLAKAYYRQFTDYALRRQPDIIGHFDVITKFNNITHMFDTDSAAYRRIALEALEAIVQSGAIFEVNTRCMASGYSTTPYPAPFLLKRLLELGGSIVISSDAHEAGLIDAHFATVRTQLRDMGFSEVMEYAPKGFIPVPLQ